MKRAIITVGLGFGDEGKGATVDFLCRRYNSDLVIRYSGGSQAGHNVQLPDGRRHTFSQFGAGTFAGARTYLGDPVILNPTALVREAEHLEDLGVPDPYQMLTIHPRCLVSTVLHQAVNQLRELARGGGRHGSCGHGIGETRHYWLRYGDDAIRAEDLRQRSILQEKLELLRQRLFIDLQELADLVPHGSLDEYALLEMTADALAEPLLQIGSLLDLDSEAPDADTAVFEGAQGVLLDEWFGFHPHTTWSTVTPHHALEMAMRHAAEEVCVLGIVRPYTTRHGAGPFPSYDEALSARIKDRGNPWNAWQGSIRAGWLDMVLLRYAAKACAPIDNLAVSCADHLDENMRICGRYEDCQDLPLPSGPNLKHQERLNGILQFARPINTPATRDEILSALAEIALVAALANGPTHLDRECRPLRFRKRVSLASVKA